MSVVPVPGAMFVLDLDHLAKQKLVFCLHVSKSNKALQSSKNLLPFEGIPVAHRVLVLLQLAEKRRIDTIKENRETVWGQSSVGTVTLNQKADSLVGYKYLFCLNQAF